TQPPALRNGYVTLPGRTHGVQRVWPRFPRMTGVSPAVGVIVHQASGDAFLLHVESGHYFGLNRSGLVIWQAIVEGANAVDALAERWPDVSRATLEADVDALVASLRKAALVTDGTAADPAEPAE